MVAARARCCGIVTGLLVLCAAHAPAQSRLLGPFKPLWLHRAGMLRHYLCSPAFDSMHAHGRDRAAVDSLFAHAMRISDNDIADALLACTVACFDHSLIHVRLGFLTLPLPLSLDDDSLNACARRNLPSNLFYDSPPGGDRDKLQHFFGSAYLQWVTNSSAATQAVGESIELLEPSLIVGGTDDPRDLRADKAGQAFAILISTYYYVAPSVILEMVR